MPTTCPTVLSGSQASLLSKSRRCQDTPMAHVSPSDAQSLWHFEINLESVRFRRGATHLHRPPCQVQPLHWSAEPSKNLMHRLAVSEETVALRFHNCQHVSQPNLVLSVNLRLLCHQENGICLAIEFLITLCVCAWPPTSARLVAAILAAK